MTAYHLMKRSALEALLLERVGGMKKWMLLYILKDRMADILVLVDQKAEKGEKVALTDEMIERLRAKQRAHKTASKQRAQTHGTTRLTVKETLTALVNDHPGLTYAGKRVFDKPFESPTGNSRGATVASVFTDAEHKEHYFTRAECKYLNEVLDVEMPKEALRHATKQAGTVAHAQGHRTLKDLW